MKKISILILIATNAMFLTGCWKRKQQEVNLCNEPIKIDEAPSYEIPFTDNNEQYNTNEGKSIFDDENITENNVENQNKEINNITPAEDNFLNTLTIEEENNNNKINNILIETNKFHINTVLFEFDVFENIRPDYEKILQQTINEIIIALNKNPNATIIIEGHACNSCGSERYNLELSNQRALTIKNNIMKQININPEKISVYGCGTSHLIVHGSRAEQSPNRRVEIFITK